MLYFKKKWVWDRQVVSDRVLAEVHISWRVMWSGEELKVCADWSFEKPIGVSGGYTRDTRSYGVVQESINRPGLDWGRGKRMLPDTPFIRSNVTVLQISACFLCSARWSRCCWFQPDYSLSPAELIFRVPAGGRWSDAVFKRSLIS